MSNNQIHKSLKDIPLDIVNIIDDYTRCKNCNKLNCLNCIVNIEELESLDLETCQCVFLLLLFFIIANFPIIIVVLLIKSFEPYPALMLSLVIYVLWFVCLVGCINGR